ncbi:MAG: hypothetical protein JSV34_04210 [Candidatus Omnitrophota bacterium]|nr:MAG: hypothetical protein JSV34_04210 [Candidatus Omnitrophota bacterium]
MLSREDYKNYTDQIFQLEKKMSIFYSDCAQRLKDESIRQACRDLSAAEEKHMQMVKELKELFGF